jgi:hypothetical protein
MEYNLGNVHKEMKTGAAGMFAGFLALLWIVIGIAFYGAVVFVIVHFARKFW